MRPLSLPTLLFSGMKRSARKGKGKKWEKGKGKRLIVQPVQSRRECFSLLFHFSLFPIFPFLHSLQLHTAKMLRFSFSLIGIYFAFRISDFW
jgi:hypothetical protein